MSVWNLANAETGTSLNVTTDDSTGAVWGTLTYQNIIFNIQGAWIASGSNQSPRPKPNYSAFGFSGQGPTPNTPTFVSATGIMDGPGYRPNKIEININLSATTSGALTAQSETLLPA